MEARPNPSFRWPEPAQQAVPAPSAENKKRLLLQSMSWRRRSGAQVNPLAPRPAPRPLALAVVIAVVRKPSGGMPPLCRQVMADSEFACVHAYLANSRARSAENHCAVRSLGKPVRFNPHLKPEAIDSDIQI
jgi:hypothetical protein